MAAADISKHLYMKEMYFSALAVKTTHGPIDDHAIYSELNKIFRDDSIVNGNKQRGYEYVLLMSQI